MLAGVRRILYGKISINLLLLKLKVRGTESVTCKEGEAAIGSLLNPTTGRV